MNKSQRIYFSTGDTENKNQDKYIKVKLEQDVETLEFMSMSLGTADVYQNFNADYGVLVGRVIANGGIGIPNVKISIFIPLTDEDAENKDIYSVYPYKTPRDKNNEGKRYNLLPRVARKDPKTGIITPKQPFGSFPIKEEIVGNLPFLDVYKKYYKYTALTNNAGDYMIFGIPIGTQTIHMSADITDIGEYSMNPAAKVINLGYSPNLFTNNNSKIKPSIDLNDLPNIEMQEISVDIRPFWGDIENFEIGITRQDFRIRSVLKNTFIIFGSVFTDGSDSMWGEDFKWTPLGERRIAEMFRARNDGNTTVGMYSKRIGKVSEKIYYYPPNVTDTRIDSGAADPKTDMLLLDPSEYSVYKRDGDFAFIISCNRNKIVTNDIGEQIPIQYDSTNGIFTKFRGFLTLEITSEDIPMDFSGEIGNNTEVRPFRYKLKFPQHANRNQSFSRPAPNENIDTLNWRKENYSFEGGKIYSVAKFHGLTSNNDNTDAHQWNLDNGFLKEDTINVAYNNDPFWNVGIIVNGDYDDYNNSIAQFPSNSSIGGFGSVFGSNWMNLSIYLPQLGYLVRGYSYNDNVRSADHFTKNNEDDTNNVYYYTDNLQGIAAGQFNTKFFARSDLNWTDIIEVPKTDILAMADVNSKGFTDSHIPTATGTTYRNGDYIPVGWSASCPINGGKDDGTGDSGDSNDTKKYFYKGFDTANCIEYVISLGLV